MHSLFSGNRARVAGYRRWPPQPSADGRPAPPPQGARASGGRDRLGWRRPRGTSIRLSRGALARWAAAELTLDDWGHTADLRWPAVLRQCSSLASPEREGPSG